MRKAFVNIVCALPALQAFGWSLLSGIIGTLILAGFFSGIMSLELLSMLLPLIAGANASISGYMLIERAEEEFTRKNMASAAVGLLVALLSIIAANAICFNMAGFFLLSGSQALVATAMGIIGGWSGGVLAVKYRKLKEQATAV